MSDKDRDLYEATTPGEWGELNGNVIANGHTRLSRGDAIWIAHAHNRWMSLLRKLLLAGRRIEQQKATIKSLTGDVERAYDIVKDQRREIEHLEHELCRERDKGTEMPF